MNLWIGGAGGQMPLDKQGETSPPWRLYLMTSDIVDPGPAMTFLFLDEREDAINFGNFGVNMSGWSDAPQLTGFDWDWPASYHDRAGALAFADGHAEMHQWSDARTMPPLVRNTLLPRSHGTAAVCPSPNNRDIVWLQERATRRLN